MSKEMMQQPVQPSNFLDDSSDSEDEILLMLLEDFGSASRKKEHAEASQKKKEAKEAQKKKQADATPV